MKLSELKPLDFSEHLTEDETIAEFITTLIEEGDAAVLASALGDVAKARGMNQIAQETGIGRTALYKALRSDASPRFDTINKVCNALGVRLIAQRI